MMVKIMKENFGMVQEEKQAWEGKSAETEDK